MMVKKIDYQDLIKKAKKLRQDTFLTFIEKGEAHLGGSFSMIEALLTLYEVIMKKRDKFILSKAHASIPLCLLLRNYGFNPSLTTHLEIDTKNGINCTAGSLGHGLPIGVGMAIARKKQRINGKIYIMISDGECQEGTTWESLLISSKYKLDNLVILIDYNKIQALTKLKDGLPLDNLASKLKAFNMDCIEIADGHSFKALISAFKKENNKGKPLIIILHTIKGKGIKEFENDPVWHARKIKGKDIQIGKKKLGII